MNIGEMMVAGEKKPTCSGKKKIGPSATFSTKNFTWTSLGLNLGPSRGEVGDNMAERWQGPARTCKSRHKHNIRCTQYISSQFVAHVILQL